MIADLKGKYAAGTSRKEPSAKKNACVKPRTEIFDTGVFIGTHSEPGLPQVGIRILFMMCESLGAAALFPVVQLRNHFHDRQQNNLHILHIP